MTSGFAGRILAWPYTQSRSEGPPYWYCQGFCLPTIRAFVYLMAVEMWKKEKWVAVSIVHSNKVVRSSLVALIGGTEGFRCVGVHARVEEALKTAALEQPHVVLASLDPPDPKALECIGHLHDRFPHLEVLVLVPSCEPRLITSLLEAGVDGCLVKPVAPAELLEAIRQVRDFGVAVSSAVARLLVGTVRKTRASRRCLEKLSRRELEVLECLSRGYLTKQIADRCAISTQTVNSHLAHIYEKLNVHCRAGAVGKFFGR